MTDHDVLIEQLSRSITPVKRPLQPVWRVISWLALALPSGLVAGLIINRTLTDWSQTGAAWTIAQLLLTFVTGTLAIRNAFLLCIAGQTPLGWKWFLPLVALWGACTIANFHTHHAVQPDGIEGLNCYLFMLGVSTPMVLIVLAYLRRTRSLFPAQSLATAGAGVSCMALTLLALCHSTHISMEDLLMHLAATVTIIGGTVALGYHWVAIR